MNPICQHIHMVLRFSLAFYKMKCGNFASIDLENEMYMGKPRYQLANSTHFFTDIYGTNLLEIKT